MSMQSDCALSRRTARPVRVIAVDDDPDYLEFLTEVLQESKENIEVAGAFLSPTGALDRLEDLAPDVALVDVAMPGMDGITCAKEFLQRRPGTAVVLISGSPQNLHCENGFLCGACGFLGKPFRPRQLEAAIRSAACGLAVLTRPAVEALYGKTKGTRAQLISDKHLTQREAQALDSVACFRENKEIADEFGYSVPLTQKILRSAFCKLGVRTRLEALALWRSR